MIIDINRSMRKNKRFAVTMSDGTKFHFGLPKGSTYIDHRDKLKRTAYRRRHLGNEQERYLITNLVPSPSLFAYYLLWGDSISLEKNIHDLNALLKDTHK